MVIIIDNNSHDLIDTFESIELAMDSAAGAPEKLVYNLDNSIPESVKMKVRGFIRVKDAGQKIHDYLREKGIRPKQMAAVYVDCAVDEFEEVVSYAEKMGVTASLSFK